MLNKSSVLKLFLKKWSLITLLVGFFVTVFSVTQITNRNADRIEVATRDFSNQLTDEIVQRFEFYQYGLRGVRGTVLTAGQYAITREIFHQYSSTRDVDLEFPGARGFGFIRRVKPKDETFFLNSARYDDWNNFEIKQLSPHEGERYVIQYIEPVDRNVQAVGLDIASESNRRTAAKSALLSGEVRLSGPITLIQATGHPSQSFLILMPIYSTNAVPATEELRDKFGFGWSYAPLITDDVLSGLGINSDYFQIELSDVTEPGNSEVFFHNDPSNLSTVYSLTDEISIYGRTWQVSVGVTPSFVANLNQMNGLEIGLLGMLVTVLSSGLVGANAASRTSQAAVFAEQSKLASIVSSSADGIISLTLEGYITSWNLGAEQILGFTNNEVLGRYYLELIVPESLRKESQGLINNASGGKSVSSLETLRLHKDGRLIPVSISVSPVFADQQKVSGISVTVRDISVQKRVEQEIKDLNANLEEQVQERTAEAMHVRDQLLMATDAAELGVWVWNCITNNLEWNDKMFEIYDYPVSLREQGIDYSHWLNRIHPDDQEDAQNSLQKALANEGKWNFSYRLVLPNGQIRHINARSIVDFDEDGTAVSVTGVNRDITSEVKLEQSLRLAKQISDDANAAKSNFLSNMSHELRTPMNAVLGMLTLVKNTELTARQNDYVTKSEVAAKSLLNVLNDILDYSKIDAGKMELDPHTFELDPLLQELSTILSGVKSSGEVEVLFDLDQSIPQQLTGDRMRLLQVLINLTNNALKFTAQGTVILRLSSQSRTDDTINILVSIEDTGIGIAPEQQERIFSGFSQAEASTARRFGGTGLGLVISRSLIELMGGQLQLSSEVDKGSRFYFELQFGLEEVTQQSKNYPQYQSCRVLVCDDNETSLQILASTLSVYCSSVNTVSSGYEALTAVVEQDKANNPYDIIFMDWRMPGMDGLQATQAILETSGLGKKPKIIMVTAYGAHELEQQLNSEEERVFDDYLVKPATPLQFRAVLDRLVGGVVVNDSAEPKQSQRERRLDGVKVLVVEDNEFNRLIAFELLGIEGAEVTLAEDGLSGVDYVINGQLAFDVVLMDMQMPDIDGLEATRRIRRDEKFNDLPIIAMTANVAAQDIQDCLNAGMNDHIGKPVDVRIMVETIKKYLPATFFEVQPQTTVHFDAKLTKNESTNKELTVDLAAAVERLGGDTVLFRTLLELFEREADKLFDELDQQWRQNDKSAMLMTLHSLKGSSSNLGATAVAALASDWELEFKQQIANSTDISDARVLEQEHISQLRQLCRAEVGQLLAALDGEVR